MINEMAHYPRIQGIARISNQLYILEEFKPMKDFFFIKVANLGLLKSNRNCRNKNSDATAASISMVYTRLSCRPISLHYKYLLTLTSPYLKKGTFKGFS